jgi:hypothetical protein
LPSPEMKLIGLINFSAATSSFAILSGIAHLLVLLFKDKYF